MKWFIVPVRWVSIERVRIRANTAEEAMNAYREGGAEQEVLSCDDGDPEIDCSDIYEEREQPVRHRIAALAVKTADAFSFDRFGKNEWRRAIKLLIDRGLTDREIEAVLRSKWPRWAADAAPYGAKPRGDDLIIWIMKSFTTPEAEATEIQKLVEDTFDGTETK